MRLSGATTHFPRQQAANGCSVHTQKAYARDLAAFARWLGRDASLSAIKPDDLARFLINDVVLCTPDSQPRKPITINRTKSVRRGGRLCFASELDLLAVVPFVTSAKLVSLELRPQ